MNTNPSLTKSEALGVLIMSAGANCAGTGTGIRTIPSNEERERCKEAARKVWKEAFGYTPSDDDLRNMGFR